MANVNRYLRGSLADAWIKKTGTTEIQIGDFVKIVNSSVVEAAVSGDYTSLVGIALQQSPTTDKTATKVRVGLNGYGTVWHLTAASSDKYQFGDMFKISASQEVTQVSASNPLISATNTVAICVESMDVSGTLVRCILLPGRLNNQIGRVNTGTLD